jgi:hypothetical protein
MRFRIIAPITGVAVIITGTAIRERKRLWKMYGRGRWRKMKGFSIVEFDDGSTFRAELHWYEAHGIGKKEYKVKHTFEHC